MAVPSIPNASPPIFDALGLSFRQEQAYASASPPRNGSGSRWRNSNLTFRRLSGRNAFASNRRGMAAARVQLGTPLERFSIALRSTSATPVSDLRDALMN